MTLIGKFTKQTETVNAFVDVPVGTTLYSEVLSHMFGNRSLTTWHCEDIIPPEWFYASIALYKMGTVPKNFVDLGRATRMPYFTAPDSAPEAEEGEV